MTAVPRSAPRRRLVVDASVVLKWQLDDEEHVQAAIALRDDYLIAGELALDAPALLLYEITNGIHVAARRARLAPAMAEEALANLLACEIELHPPDPGRTLGLARRYGISGYDAAYVALAEQLRAELWTGDRRLHASLQRRLPWSRWIGEYAPTSTS